MSALTVRARLRCGQETDQLAGPGRRTWRGRGGSRSPTGRRCHAAVEPEEFTTQGDAESWIGEAWKELKEGGADQVQLFEDSKKIYGPMSLHAEQA